MTLPRSIALCSTAISIVAAAGCASSSTDSDGRPTPRRSTDVITEDELRTSTATNLLDAVRRLRPRWLTARRGVTSFEDAESGTMPKLVVDNIVIGSLQDLDQIHPHDVRLVRFVNAADATTRWGGVGFASGAIEVVTKRE